MFVERIMEEIRPLLPADVEEVRNYPVTKNNGIVYTGLVIHNAHNIAPTIYLNPYYHQYLAGRSFEAILSDIAETYKKNCKTENFDSKQILDWDFVKSNVVRKIINYEKNSTLLKEMPYKKIEDLAIIYQISVGDVFDNKEYATIAVKNDFFKEWNVSLEELDKNALENTRRIFAARLDSLADVFSYITGDTLPFLEEMNIYILTNKLKINGAIHVVDMDTMDLVANTLEMERFYVIPSSVHEVLLLPYRDEYDYKQLEDIIREVNDTQLLDEEVLSDRAYVVDTKTHTFMLAVKYEEYIKEKELQENQIQMLKGKAYQEPEGGPKL